MQQSIKISGFLVLKNAVIQGYPFIEAILSALPVCDEFLIADGYSSDDTWNALQAIMEKFPGKIKLFRDKWEGNTNMSQIVAQMTNKLRRRCQGEYCFSIQANEIIHEDTIEEIKAIPELYPQTEIFFLPFYHYFGRSNLFQIDYRKRFFKNLPHIISRADGTHVGYDNLYLLLHPKILLSYLLNRSGEKVFYLSKPIHRYNALFPKNYFNKIKARYEIFKDKKYRETIDFTYKMAEKAWEKHRPGSSTPEAYWDEYVELILSQHKNDAVIRNNLSAHIIKRPQKSPSLVQHLFDRWEYNLTDSLKLLERIEAV